MIHPSQMIKFTDKTYEKQLALEELSPKTKGTKKKRYKLAKSGGKICFKCCSSENIATI